MSTVMRRKLKKTLLLAFKIAFGSGLAIYIAEAMHLEYAASAGTVTLLSLLATKWGTVKLSLFRLITFLLTVLMAYLLIPYMHSEWLAYGVIVFILVFFCNMMGWLAALSVNAVIASHYMTKADLSPEFLYNEFMLVFIGVAIAFILNLFHLNKSQKKHLMEGICYGEDLAGRFAGTGGISDGTGEDKADEPERLGGNRYAGGQAAGTDGRGEGISG